MPDRIKALNNVGTPASYLAGSRLTESAVCGQSAYIHQQILLQIEEPILVEPSAQPLRHPPAYPQGIPLEELTEIPRDNETVHFHIVPVRAEGEGRHVGR